MKIIYTRFAGSSDSGISPEKIKITLTDFNCSNQLRIIKRSKQMSTSSLLEFSSGIRNKQKKLSRKHCMLAQKKQK